MGIFQAEPLSGLAAVMITLDISQLQYSIETLLKDLKDLSATKTVELSAIE